MSIVDNRNRDREELKYNDTSQLVFQLAVFSLTDFKIYKLTDIDWRGMRYGVSGDRMSRYFKFDDAQLFNFMNEQQFIYYYEWYRSKYERPHTNKFIFDWLRESANRIEKNTLDPEQDPTRKPI